MNTRKKVPLRYSNNAAPCPKFGWARKTAEHAAPDPPTDNDNQGAVSPDPPESRAGVRANANGRAAEVTPVKKNKKERQKMKKSGKKAEKNRKNTSSTIANTTGSNASAGIHEDITCKSPQEIEYGWNYFYRQLVEHKKRHGNLRVTLPPSTTTNSATEKNKQKQALLAQWCTLQCMEKDALTPSRRKALEKIGFPFNNPTPDKFRFEVMFAKLQVFHKKWGDCLVPVRWKTDPKFGRWVSRQRETQAVMPPDRKARLDALNFTWRVCVGDKKMVKDEGRNQPIPGFDAFTVWAPPTALPSSNFGGNSGTSHASSARNNHTTTAHNHHSSGSSGSSSSSSEDEEEEGGNYDEESKEDDDEAHPPKEEHHAAALPTTPTGVTSSTPPIVSPAPGKAKSSKDSQFLHPAPSLSSANNTTKYYSMNTWRWSMKEKERLCKALLTGNDLDDVVQQVGTRTPFAVQSFASREYPELYEQFQARNQNDFLATTNPTTTEIATTTTTTPKLVSIKKNNKKTTPKATESHRQLLQSSPSFSSPLAVIKISPSSSSSSSSSTTTSNTNNMHHHASNTKRVIIPPPSSSSVSRGMSQLGGNNNKKRKKNSSYSSEEARSFAFACTRKIKQLQQQHYGGGGGSSRPTKRTRKNE